MRRSELIFIALALLVTLTARVDALVKNVHESGARMGAGRQRVAGDSSHLHGRGERDLLGLSAFAEADESAVEAAFSQGISICGV